MCKGTNCIHKIMNLLRVIQGSLNGHIESSAENLGITTSQFMVMFEIYNNKDISLIELSEKLDLPKSSVSRLVDQLVNKEIVIREIPKENRRTVKLSISPEFLKSTDVCNITSELNESIIGDLEPQKTEAIISALEDLILVLKKKSTN
ncbi:MULTISPECIES: MarR family winged helix-turn-helix transcriptional regulator [Clostridium]|uniref:MarR family transcriptional regulator n=1 Tax=Clostridium paridis TaxID=2803863 RepID=A0A937K5M9_9CLOT|nr:MULTISPECIES: MarR family transcriptional regulator [Clostridium]MBL4933224.1 MarR family transcriptional regulator [Clostridium paridis]MDD7794350.1 MarR family transcriptional regulator [Clostridium sp. 'White wine YQ']